MLRNSFVGVAVICTCVILNEVLSLNAQEWLAHVTPNPRILQSSMKS